MQRFFLIPLLLVATSAHAGEPGAKETIAYLQKLQTTTGGFLSQAPQPNIRLRPTLGATASAVRALHYRGGEVTDKTACIKFVESCYDPASGGFSDFPKGAPGVVPTAIGLMAVTELKMPTKKYADGAIKYLSDHAKGFDEIRIAVAGLERLNATTPKKEAWLKEVAKTQNPDGTFGNGAGQARDTGGRVVSLLRLGVEVPQKEQILKALRAGQRQNGGYGKEGDAIASDLETTYRVMRCFMMMKSKPGNVDGIRAFLAKCRNADGGYGVAPGQTSSVSGTYYASIVLLWLKESK